MARPSTFHQFIRFGTDAYGLERLLRFFQSISQILASYPLLSHNLIYLLSTQLPFALLFPATPKSYMILTTPVLLALRGRLALARRFFRIFRFLEAFDSAYGAATGSGAPGLGGAEGWLEFGAKVCNGFYLLLESLTLLDDMGVAGQGGWDGVLGAKRAMEWNIEGQRFWFLSLVCGILLGLVRLWKLSDAGKGVKVKGEKNDVTDKRKPKDDGEIRRKRREEKGKMRKLWRKLVADVMDLAGPGKVVGWLPVDSGVVGILMLGSTWLTGMEVWERCGKEVALMAEK